MPWAWMGAHTESRDNQPQKHVINCPNGIDTELADELAKTFIWVPSLVSGSDDSEDSLAGPEAVTDEELEEAFDTTDREKTETPREVTVTIGSVASEVLEGRAYDWNELKVVNKGTVSPICHSADRLDLEIILPTTLPAASGCCGRRSYPWTSLHEPEAQDWHGYFEAARL
ncbi:hypothetical protein BU15DRAFT_59203 [Melanogaster broomeanus]|nr:hypothetical protein BU15DRAFT_59203 [Melanogaster broomeanus]